MAKGKVTSAQRVKSIARYITKKLKDAGVYDATLSYQVELVASDLLIYRKFRDACLDEATTVTVDEKSREGHTRTKVSPVFSALRMQSKIVREGLDALTMNIKSKKVKNDVEDSFGKFMSEFNDED